MHIIPLNRHELFQLLECSNKTGMTMNAFTRYDCNIACMQTDIADVLLKCCDLFY